MSRYILSPSECGNLFMLIPTEGLINRIQTIEIPDGIFPKLNYNDLLIKLIKADVRRSKDGLMVMNNKQTHFVYDDFVRDCCSGNFKLSYEPIYCKLRDYGITF